MIQNNKSIEVTLRVSDDGSPIIFLSSNIDIKNSETDLFHYFLNMIQAKDKTYKVELEPFTNEDLKVDRLELPENIRENKLEDIPFIYKNKTVNLAISLKEIVKNNMPNASVQEVREAAREFGTANEAVIS